MPKETFFNLPDKKRDRIIEAAVEEFSSRPYHMARITAIADNANIAKGSFYQYFEGKKDLFKHILDIAVNKKMEYINRDMKENKKNQGFFHTLRGVYLSGFRFAKENPRMTAIGNKLLNNQSLQNEIFDDYKDRTSDFFRQLLEVGLVEGELDPELDPKLISRLLTNLTYALVDIAYEDGKIDPNSLDDETETIDEILSFIEKGIKKRD